MKVSELIPGRRYTIAGRGEMLLPLDAEFAGDDQPSVRLLQHGNYHYWASPDEILFEPTAEILAERAAGLKASGLQCREAECWCREFYTPLESGKSLTAQEG